MTAISPKKATKNWERSTIEGKVRKAILTTLGKSIELKSTDSFVVALGFNSLRMVSLSLALEDEFETPLLLNDWISGCDDPRQLTVGSLVDYIEKMLEG